MLDHREEITNAPIVSTSVPAETPKDLEYELPNAIQADSLHEEAPPRRSRWRIFAIMTALLVRLSLTQHLHVYATNSFQLCCFQFAVSYVIVSTAVPTISSYFGSTSGYIWIGSSTTLAIAATSPIWGKLSDIWDDPFFSWLNGTLMMLLGDASRSSSVPWASLLLVPYFARLLPT